MKGENTLKIGPIWSTLMLKNQKKKTLDCRPMVMSCLPKSVQCSLHSHNFIVWACNLRFGCLGTWFEVLEFHGLGAQHAILGFGSHGWGSWKQKICFNTLAIKRYTLIPNPRKQ